MHDMGRNNENDWAYNACVGSNNLSAQSMGGKGVAFFEAATFLNDGAIKDRMPRTPPETSIRYDGGKVMRDSIVTDLAIYPMLCIYQIGTELKLKGLIMRHEPGFGAKKKQKTHDLEWLGNRAVCHIESYDDRDFFAGFREGIDEWISLIHDLKGIGLRYPDSDRFAIDGIRTVNILNLREGARKFEDMIFSVNCGIDWYEDARECMLNP